MFDLEQVKTESLVSVKDYEKLKEEIIEFASKYKPEMINQDNYKDAKKDLAYIRKVRKALNDKRIALEGEWLKPFDNFRDEVATLLSILDNPIKAVDTTIKEIESVKDKEEEEARAKKITILKTMFDAKEYSWITFEEIPIEKVIDMTVEDAIDTINKIVEAHKYLIRTLDDEGKIAYFVTGKDHNAAIEYVRKRKKAVELVDKFNETELPF